MTRNTTNQIFDVWVHGRKEDLVRGSGAKILVDGFVADHYFLLPTDIDDYHIQDGDYHLELHASIWGKKATRSLFSIGISVRPDQAKALNISGNSLNFDWSEKEQRYITSVKRDFEAPFK